MNDVPVTGDMTYAEITDLRFDMCLNRLVKLREFKAPSQIIVNEVAMLFDRCAMRYGGDKLWAEVGRRSVERARVAMGFCPDDDAASGEVRRLAPGETQCPECIAESATANDEIDAEYGS